LGGVDRGAIGNVVAGEPEAGARSATTAVLSGWVSGAGNRDPAAGARVAPPRVAFAAGLRPAGDFRVFVSFARGYAGVVSSVFCGVRGGLSVEPALFVVPQFLVAASGGSA